LSPLAAEEQREAVGERGFSMKTYQLVQGISADRVDNVQKELKDKDDEEERRHGKR
jgi:hypothetical protein